MMIVSSLGVWANPAAPIPEIGTAHMGVLAPGLGEEFEVSAEFLGKCQIPIILPGLGGGKGEIMPSPPMPLSPPPLLQQVPSWSLIAALQELPARRAPTLGKDKPATAAAMSSQVGTPCSGGMRRMGGGWVF